MVVDGVEKFMSRWKVAQLDAVSVDSMGMYNSPEVQCLLGQTELFLMEGNWKVQQ